MIYPIWKYQEQLSQIYLLIEGVSSHLIDVSTREGIVTLSGSVDNLLAKERAIKNRSNHSRGKIRH